MADPEQEAPIDLRVHEGLLDLAERVETVELRAGERDSAPVEHGALRKLWVTLGCFLVLIALSYALPPLVSALGGESAAERLAGFQPWRLDEDYVPFWNVVGREWRGEGAGLDAAELARERLEVRARAAVDVDALESVVDRKPIVAADAAGAAYPEYAGHADDAVVLARNIENLEGLEGFYESLTRTDMGYVGAVTRVSHWGDSVLGNDGITHAIRLRMQSRFGDAGHGFHALTKYDASYKHKAVGFEMKSPWTKCYVIRGCMEDGRYGYGGTTVWSTGGAESRFRTVEQGPVGRSASRFELWYARQPHGGKFRIKVDDAAPKFVETGLDEGAAIEDAWEVVEVPDGAHEFAIRASGGGKARAYGVVIEREGPGVVWDGMALIGSFVKRMLNHDPDHIAGQIAHRDPDLIVLMFGGNDMARVKGPLRKTMEPLEQEYREVIRSLRRGKPGVSCLIMSPIDHGELRDNRIESRVVVPRMVEAQRRVAISEGCAFFDTYAAMGGQGSARRWHNSAPRLLGPDLAHPTKHGHALIGKMFYEALMSGYAEFRRTHQGAPLPSVTASPNP